MEWKWKMTLKEEGFDLDLEEKTAGLREGFNPPGIKVLTSEDGECQVAAMNATRRFLKRHPEVQGNFYVLMEGIQGPQNYQATFILTTSQIDGFKNP